MSIRSLMDIDGDLGMPICAAGSILEMMRGQNCLWRSSYLRIC